MSSYGSWSITARATVRPPKPESKIPIGTWFCGPVVTVLKPTGPSGGRSGPDLGVQEVLAGVQVGGVGAGREILGAAVADDQHDVGSLPGLDRLRGLSERGMHDRPAGQSGEDALPVEQLAYPADRVAGADGETGRHIRRVVELGDEALVQVA